MRLIFLSMLLTIYSNRAEKNEDRFIYQSNKFPWYIFYDSNNGDCDFIEIGGIKYGYIDKLIKVNQKDTISKSEKGILFYKNKKLCYYSKDLKKEFLLEKVNYKDSFKDKRFKIFDTYAFLKGKSFLLTEKQNKDFYNIVKSDFEIFEGANKRKCKSFNFEDFLIKSKNN